MLGASSRTEVMTQPVRSDPQLLQQTRLSLATQNGVGCHGPARGDGGDSNPGEGAGTTKPQILEWSRHPRKQTLRRGKSWPVAAFIHV